MFNPVEWEGVMREGRHSLGAPREEYVPDGDSHRSQTSEKWVRAVAIILFIVGVIALGASVLVRAEEGLRFLTVNEVFNASGTVGYCRATLSSR